MFKTALLCISLVTGSLAANEATELLASKAKIAELDFDQIQNETRNEETPLLASLGKESTEKANGCFGYIGVPVMQGEQFINGAWCHVAYYSDAVITTVHSGSHYGLQVVSSYSGYIITYNPFFQIDYTYSGKYLRHEYFDCTIVTGSTQAIFAK